MTTEHDDLVAMLQRATQTGRLRWKETDNEDAFVAVLQSGTMTLSRQQSTETPEWDYVIEIAHPATDRVVDRFQDDNPDLFRAMGSLFDLASRQARGADEVLGGIIKELQERAK